MQSLNLPISIPSSASITITNTRAKRVRKIAPGAVVGGKWWTPLFGWSGEPDYIEPAVVAEAENRGEGKAQIRPIKKFRGLTEEKARELRMKMMEMETFHDVMYHSAIASRLASDPKPRS